MLSPFRGSVAAVESKRCGGSFKIPARYEDLPEYTVFLHADAPEKLAENMLLGERIRIERNYPYIPYPGMGKQDRLSNCRYREALSGWIADMRHCVVMPRCTRPETLVKSTL